MDKDKIRIIQGDITRLQVTAIVNAANEGLVGGGGVDGAIHRAAGPELLKECRAIGGCPTGEARLTQGYNLPATYVIHTVGPVWRGGKQGEAELLAKAYRSCLALAAQEGITEIAFSSVSTGVYGFPVALAAPIALNEIFREIHAFKRVDMVCFNAEVMLSYQVAWKQLPE